MNHISEPLPFFSEVQNFVMGCVIFISDLFQGRFKFYCVERFDLIVEVFMIFLNWLPNYLFHNKHVWRFRLILFVLSHYFFKNIFSSIFLIWLTSIFIALICRVLIIYKLFWRVYGITIEMFFVCKANIFVDCPEFILILWIIWRKNKLRRLFILNIVFVALF